MYNRVTIDDNGFINRQRTKKKLPQRRTKHNFKKSEQPRSHSHKLADVSTTKGMRPLMRQSEESKVCLNHMELNNDKVKLPTDHRCHPAIPIKARK